MYEDLIKEFREESPFEKLYQNGFEVESLKELVVGTFAAYFQDSSSLDRHSTNALLTGWSGFVKLKENDWALQIFEVCLGLLNRAKKEGVPVHSIVSEWTPYLNDGLTKYWSFKKMEQELSTLSAEDHLEECFKMVGQLLEGFIKTYLKLFVHVNSALRDKEPERIKIDNRNLGLLVGDLRGNADFAEMLAPLPWELPLNQWRNVAYHHKAKLEGKLIVCTYGENKSIDLSRDDLTNLVRKISSILSAFRSAEFVFFYDNYSKFERVNGMDQKDSFSIRKEVGLLELFSGVNSQGFSIIGYVEENASATLIIEDMTLIEPMKRAIHSTQFVYHLWLHTGLSSLSVKYQLKGGKPYLISSAESALCLAVAEGKKDMSYFAKNIKLKQFSDVE